MPASSLKTLALRFDTFVKLVVDKLKTPAVASLTVETGTLAAGATKSIDLVPLLPEGTSLSEYQIFTTLVDLKVIDTDAASPFKDQAVSAVATLGYGISAAGLLTLRNDSAASATYWLRVITPALK